MATNTTPRGAFTRTSGIGGVGLAGTDYVQPGVVDQSGYYAGQAAAQRIQGDIVDINLINQGIQAAGNTAMFLGQGAVLHGVNQEVQGLVDNYNSSINGPIEAAGLEAMGESMWANIGDKSKPTRIEDLNTVQEKHAETLKKLDKAYKQGAITSLDDLEARVLKATREAVNRTPGMANEIMQQTQQVMHLSGVRGMVNPFEQAAKMQAKQEAELKKRLMDYHEKKGLEYDPLNPDINDMASTYQAHLRQRQKAEQLKELAASEEQMSKEEVKTFLRQDYPDISQDAYNNVRNAAVEIFQPGGSYQNQVLAFKNVAESLKRSLLDSMQRSGGLKDPDGRAAHKYTTEYIDNLVKTVDGFENGTDALKAIQNKANIMAAMDETRIRSKVSLTAIEAASKISGLATSMAIKANAGAVQRLVDGLVQQTLTPELWDSSELREGIPDVTSLTGGLILSNQTEPLTASFESVARSMNMGFSKSDRITKLTEHFKELGKETYRNKIKTPDPLVERSFLKAAELYLNDVGGMFQQAIRDANSTLGMSNESLRFQFPAVERASGIAEEQEVGARAYALSNGLLDIETSNDPDGRHAATWRRDIVDRYNDVIKTYANVSNVTYKEASDLILSRFGRMLNIPEEELPKTTARDLVKKEEGFRTKAYLDSAGVPTIGFGFTTIDGKPVKMGDTITREEALTQLEKQLPKYQTFKSKLSGISLSEDQEAALTSFEYNLGSGIWDKGAKSILYAVQAGDFDFAMKQMLQYDKAKDPKSGKLKAIPGLSARRMREATMLAKAE